MLPMKKKDCELIAGELKRLGWNPCVGVVMSYTEVVGHKLGILVEAGDERFQWTKSAQAQKDVNGPDQNSGSANDMSGLINFFAAAHAAEKNRPLETQPVGFTSKMAGTTMVEITPGPTQTLNDFFEKIKKISTVQVQMGIFSSDEPKISAEDQELKNRAARAETAMELVNSASRSPTLTAPRPMQMQWEM